MRQFSSVVVGKNALVGISGRSSHCVRLPVYGGDGSTSAARSSEPAALRSSFPHRSTGASALCTSRTG